MSFIEETITKLLQIAQNSRNESAFQKDTDYMKFKSIKLKSGYSLEINRLIHELSNLEFQEERVYWNKRLLKITDKCNKEDRHDIYGRIIVIYDKLEKYELVVRYCKEALDNVKGTNLRKQYLEYLMGRALYRLKKYREAISYFNSENLTYFTNPQVNNHSLKIALIFYTHYIECHMKNNRHADLLETMGTINICKLNSEDPNDVKNEVLKILKERPNATHEDAIWVKYICVSYVAKICFMKCQLFKGLCDIVQCRKWANFLPTIYHELNTEIRSLKTCDIEF